MIVLIVVTTLIAILVTSSSLSVPRVFADTILDQISWQCQYGATGYVLTALCHWPAAGVGQIDERKVRRGIPRLSATAFLRLPIDCCHDFHPSS